MGKHATDDSSFAGDTLPAAGGGDSNARLAKLSRIGVRRSGDDLLDTVRRLLAAHPDIVLNFRNKDFEKMDTTTKEILIANIRQMIKNSALK
ncbi:MAG: hypothetical protein U0800_20015 [Isosphaeraceae bacterium]